MCQSEVLFLFAVRVRMDGFQHLVEGDCVLEALALGYAAGDRVAEAVHSCGVNSKSQSQSRLMRFSRIDHDPSEQRRIQSSISVDR